MFTGFIKIIVIESYCFKKETNPPIINPIIVDNIAIITIDGVIPSPIKEKVNSSIVLMVPKMNPKVRLKDLILFLIQVAIVGIAITE